jgi:hypothetical protein
MRGQAFENLVQELSILGNPPWLPADWIICADSDLFRDIRRMAERRKWLKKAKAELTRRLIQERVDEIAEAWEGEDLLMVEVLLEAFPKNLELYKSILSPSHLQKWIDKASLAACGRLDECEGDRAVIYFVSAAQNQDLIKIGYTTNLESRLRSLRTSSPDELKIHLVIPGCREDEGNLHRQFSSLRVRREWFRRAQPIDDFIARHRTGGSQ